MDPFSQLHSVHDSTCVRVANTVTVHVVTTDLVIIKYFRDTRVEEGSYYSLGPMNWRASSSGPWYCQRKPRSGSEERPDL